MSLITVSWQRNKKVFVSLLIKDHFFFGYQSYMQGCNTYMVAYVFTFLKIHKNITEFYKG